MEVASLPAKIALAFQHGGFWMYPILMYQIFSLAIIVERGYALFLARKLGQVGFANQLQDSIRRGEIDLAIKKAQQDEKQYSLAKVVIAGAEAAKNFGGKDEIQGKMDEVLLHENSLLDRRVGFLAMIGNVATLTGLLGTITGMIKSFAAVAYANPADKAALLAAGISEAMNATAYGLIVAIPALLSYAIYQNRSNRLSEDLNHAALKVFNWLSYTFDPVALRNQTKAKTHAEATTTELVN